jgi:peptide/nickel transport system ATP-binding protein
MVCVISSIRKSGRDVMSGSLLQVENLTVEFRTRNGIVRAVERVDLSVGRGETLAIVGESGSGKSVTSYAVMRILDSAGSIAQGSVMFSGIDVANADEETMATLRGREISMVFQNPRLALNPIRKIGRQIEDVLIRHVQATRNNAKEKAIELLAKVRIARPEERYDAYPFELSGGMCQRVVIALALACKPRLLIADEPTTGLDVTTQKAVMDLIVELVAEQGMSMILITHDLGLAAAYCNRVIVMEKGRVVEAASATSVFKNPQEPYTKRLVRATPRPGVSLRDLLPDPEIPYAAETPRTENAGAQPLLEVRDLVKSFAPAQGASLLSRFMNKQAEAPVRSVDGISFTLAKGETLGLVGESGCGKSTTSAMIMRLLDPTSGSIFFAGRDIGAIPARSFARDADRARLQLVFQDPTDSLNPRFTAERAIADPLYRLGGVTRADEARAAVEEIAKMVGLTHDLLDRFPHQLSGGQKARVGIARAMVLRPDLVVLDEPTAALDVSVQAIVLNLLADLRAELGMSYLFVSHDLQVVRMLCDRALVMRAGRIVEEGSAAAVLEDPQHAYTRELVSAIPHPPL